MTYPATFAYDGDGKVANWRPLVQWFLAIPHFIVLYILNIVASIAMFVAWVIIVITGKLPPGIASFLSMYFRYSARVGAYAGFLHSEYPPFDFTASNEDPGGQPVRVDFVPELEGRNRLTVLLRFLIAIPAMLFIMVIGIAVYVVYLIAFFAVLFTGKWPTGMLNFVLGFHRLTTRLNAYLGLLTDEYPPFNLD